MTKELHMGQTAEAFLDDDRENETPEAAAQSFPTEKSIVAQIARWISELQELRTRTQAANVEFKRVSEAAEITLEKADRLLVRHY